MLGFTIDSVTMFVHWDKLSDYDFDWLEKLSNAKAIEYGKYSGWNVGGYKNYIIRYSKTGGIYLWGSISVFYSGYTKLLDFDELKTAIDMLGNELHLNLHNARLYRVDLALNIETTRSINQYTHNLFTDLPYLKRLTQNDGVRFEGRDKVFAIYNKKQQLLEVKGVAIFQNILRLELRLKKNIGKIFNLKEMEVQDLYHYKNYKILVDTFNKYYKKIKKRTISKDLFEVENVTPSYFDMYLKRNCIDVILGGEENAYGIIEQLARENKFKNANDKSRCRKMIADLSKNLNLSILHPLVKEIDEKVEKACMEILNK